MKPAPFEYLCPTTLEEVLENLSEYGEEAKVLSGGQSLIPVLNMRLSTPRYVIDMGRVKDLDYIREENDNIIIGARVRHRDVERSTIIKERCPLLTEAIQSVGHPQIRSRGTIAGSIAHADPSAELPCVLSALRGEIVIASADEERIEAPEDFFLTYLMTTLQPHELIKEIRFPCLSKTSGYAFLELARRHGDFALVGVASIVDLDENGLIRDVKLAVCGAHPVPCVLAEVEDDLIGKAPSDQLFAEAGERAKDYLDAEGDLHGSKEYRLHLASVLTKRALAVAVSRCKGGKNNE